jgi:hypothetical protein
MVAQVGNRDPGFCFGQPRACIFALRLTVVFETLAIREVLRSRFCRTQQVLYDPMMTTIPTMTYKFVRELMRVTSIKKLSVS